MLYFPHLPASGLKDTEMRAELVQLFDDYCDGFPAGSHERHGRPLKAPTRDKKVLGELCLGFLPYEGVHHASNRVGHLISAGARLDAEQLYAILRHVPPAGEEHALDALERLGVDLLDKPLLDYLDALVESAQDSDDSIFALRVAGRVNALLGRAAAPFPTLCEEDAWGREINSWVPTLSDEEKASWLAIFAHTAHSDNLDANPPKRWKKAGVPLVEALGERFIDRMTTWLATAPVDVPLDEDSVGLEPNNEWVFKGLIHLAGEYRCQELVPALEAFELRCNQPVQQWTWSAGEAVHERGKRAAAKQLANATKRSLKAIAG